MLQLLLREYLGVLAPVQLHRLGNHYHAGIASAEVVEELVEEVGFVLWNVDIVVVERVYRRQIYLFEQDFGVGMISLAGMEIELSRILGRQAEIHTRAGLNPHFRDRVLAEAEVLYDAA